MTHITFLASSRPFIIPEHIEAAQRFELLDTRKLFIVHDITEYWSDIMQPFLSMPYLYEAIGLENDAFFQYLEEEMQIGDTLQLFYMNNQNDYDYHLKRAKELADAIDINVGSFTYKHAYGEIQLQPKTWKEELRHRTLVTNRGITTIVKY